MCDVFTQDPTLGNAKQVVLTEHTVNKVDLKKH